jgi:DNA-directed RNA polymerase subunit RPC12/RpoP
MATMTTAPRVTAEWQCSRCGSTNRKLVAHDTREVKDQCVSCHLKHLVTPGARPVRWNARAA